MYAVFILFILKEGMHKHVSTDILFHKQAVYRRGIKW